MAKKQISKKALSLLLSVIIIMGMFVSAIPITASAEPVFPVNVIVGNEGSIFHGGIGNTFLPRRVLNPNPSGTYTNEIGEQHNIGHTYHLLRDELNPNFIEITGADYIEFDMLIEDNGAWEEYKDNLQISLESWHLSAHFFTGEVYQNGIANVIPGVTSKVRFSLDGLPAANFAQVRGLTISVSNCTNVTKDLGITINNFTADVNRPVEYPLSFVNVNDGPVVHPGNNGDVFRFDRVLNPTATGTYTDLWGNSYSIGNAVYLSRDEITPNAMDISGADYISFDLWIDDSEEFAGSWNEYKNGVSLWVYSRAHNETLVIPAADVKAALKNVKAGYNNKVYVSINGLDKNKLASAARFGFDVSGCTGATKNLHIKMTNAKADIERDSILFARANGTEWPLVHGASTGPTTVFNNYMNTGYEGALAGLQFTMWAVTNGNIIIDATNYDELTFIMNIEDDSEEGYAGTWAEYQAAWDRGEAPITLYIQNPTYGVYHFSNDSVKKAFADVVPGKDCKIELDIFDIPAEFLANACIFGVGINLATEYDLGISIRQLVYNQAIKYDETVAIIDDEAGESATFFVNNAEKVMVGKTANRTTSNNDGLLGYAGSWQGGHLSAKNIKDVTNNGYSGALRFWCYIEDVTEIGSATGSLIKIGNTASKDGGPDDGSHLFWENWHSQIKKNGWNEIILNFADVKVQNSVPDLTQINAFYMIIYGTSNLTLYFDDMCVSQDINTTTETGDINGDKEINLLDLICLKNAIIDDVNHSLVYEVYNDGSIDAKDIITLKKALFGLIELPATRQGAEISIENEII